MRSQGKYTQLYSIIKQCLIDRNYKQCQEIEQKIFTDSLYLNILGKDLPSFATDLNHSIQVEFANKNVQQQLGRFVRNPVNQLVTDYYFIKERQWHAFNCSKQIIERENAKQIIDIPTTPTPIHAYQPQFYFTKDYSDFCKQKSKGSSYILTCKRIKIFKWRFRIINVNKSGWYAPVLQAIDFKYEYESLKEDFKGISCVIYEDCLRLMMERLRLHDLRRRTFLKWPHEQENISMLYFLRNAKCSTGRRPNIFKADKQKVLLNYLKAPTLKYVLFGEGKGPLPLQEGILQAPMYEDRIKLANMESLQVLFNKKQPAKPQQKEMALWSSSDEDEDEVVNKLPAVEGMLDQSEESNDQEDPLRNLYLKEFNQMRIDK